MFVHKSSSYLTAKLANYTAEKQQDVIIVLWSERVETYEIYMRMSAECGEQQQQMFAIQGSSFVPQQCASQFRRSYC
jgi:hypothetical protein